MITGNSVEFSICGGLKDRYSVGVIGEGMDNRSRASIRLVRDFSEVVIEVRYSHEQQMLFISGRGFDVGDSEGIANFLSEGDYILDSTTLGFIEILVLLRVAKEKQFSTVDVLYVEPKSYSHVGGFSLFTKRQFDLSELYEDFFGVPGALSLVDDPSNVRTACLLGFEGSRFGQMVEQIGIRADRLSVIFGVPAFSTGWEMHSFDNNLTTLWDRRGHRIEYCSANDPFSAYRTLQLIYETLADDEELIVCPIGTKPHGLGAAIFSIDHDRVGLVYDCPTKKEGRSSKVGKAHLYSLRLR